MDNNPIGNPFDDDEAQTRNVRLAILSIGILLCCGFSIFGFQQLQTDPISLYNRYFPSPTSTTTRTATPTLTRTTIPTNTATATITLTSTPTPTATIPFVLVSPSGDGNIFEDRFESNRNGWVKYFFRTNTASVQDGKFIVRANEVGYFGAASCLGCPVFDDAYYFQAEIATATDTFAWHGLLFCAHPDRLTGYYMFLIDSQNQFYTLQKNSDEGWSTLVQPNRSRIINPFPLSNTLAVLYNHGKIDMYINGAFVHTYTPADELRCRNVGFMVQEGQIDMIVDNVFAYPIDVTATPNP